MTPTQLISRFFVLLCLVTVFSCSKDSNTLTDSEIEEAVNEENEINSSCTNPLNFIFNEKDGLVLAEFEDAQFSEDWVLKNDDENATGEGYMVWEGSQSLGQPGNGSATFQIKITNTGVYQFLWFSSVKMGNSGTDHNDTWLRFADADDFYGQKQNNGETSTVYPKGTGKTPNPEGATSDGWFKIYRSGSNLDFKWQSSTFDNNGHNVYVKFDNPGTYLMEISARSSGHGIDKFVLFNDLTTQNAAVSSTELSTISCN